MLLVLVLFFKIFIIWLVYGLKYLFIIVLMYLWCKEGVIVFRWIFYGFNFCNATFNLNKNLFVFVIVFLMYWFL